MSGYRFDRLKVLVVDDNIHMRKLVTTILQAFGVIQIYEAENGDRAWAILREANPDVVVMDWMMEGMSGIELTRMIRTNPQSPKPFVPVIMLTGHTLIEDVAEARDAGINEFIAKPVTVDRRFAAKRHPAALADRRPCQRDPGDPLAGDAGDGRQDRAGALYRTG